MGRIALLLGAMLLLGSCSGDDESPAGQYAEECDATTKCAEGLQCILGLCTASCASDMDCKALSPAGTCAGGTCFDACRDRTNCRSGLICEMFGSVEGTCRPQR
jgi:hypothetical protein